MLQAMDVAKYFMKEDPNSYQNTLDSNIKLQKMLFFAQLISLSEREEPLYSDSIRAFEHGCVVECVRLRYRDEFVELRKESLAFTPEFSESEYAVLGLAREIFGRLSAQELSDLNHSLSCWSKFHVRSESSTGYHDKDLAIIPTEELLAEVDRMRSVLEMYRAGVNDNMLERNINGVTFSYAPDFEMSDKIIQELEEFARVADEGAYGVYLDEGELVVY